MPIYDINGNSVASGNIPSSMESDEYSLYGNNPTPSNNVNNALNNIYKYPIRPVFGNEYLNGWYKKLFFGQHVNICVDGDSTTQEEYEYMKPGRRAQIIEKIMKIGGCTNFTLHKNGHGSKTAGDYVGKYYSSDLLSSQSGTQPTQESHPNGLLSETIEQNPDLIIFGYGLNDYNRYKSGTAGALWSQEENLDLQGRLDLYKSCIEEFLQRLRESKDKAINGRECYGKSEYDTAVILTVPISRDENEKWAYYCRSMIKDLCREYHCGFFDPTAVNYDHEWNQQWSRTPGSTTTPDGLHPNPWTNADFVSSIQPLLYPIGLWYTTEENLYTVTYDLTNCTVSFNPDKLRHGVKFETYLTADNGMSIQSCIVEMGNRVVDNSYTQSSGFIQVSGVSGNIKITAVAS